MSPTRTWGVVFLAASALGGCATTQKAQTPAAELERTVIELRAQNAGYVRQIEELENRVFILQDRLDSYRVADGRREVPVLPTTVRRIAPSSGGAEREVASVPPTTPRLLTELDAADANLNVEPAGSVAAVTEVEYGGEAARPAVYARPVLRASGARRGMFERTVAHPGRDPGVQPGDEPGTEQEVLADAPPVIAKSTVTRRRERSRRARRGVPPAPVVANVASLRPAPAPAHAGAEIERAPSRGEADPARTVGVPHPSPSAVPPTLSRTSPVVALPASAVAPVAPPSPAPRSVAPVVALPASAPVAPVAPVAAPSSAPRSVAPVVAQPATSPGVPAPVGPGPVPAAAAPAAPRAAVALNVLPVAPDVRAAAARAARTPLEPVAAEPIRLYRQSLDALRTAHHSAAIAGFRRFLARFPSHEYADNAQYWLGECYYDLHQLRGAAREFRRVVERYPRGNKAPDAMLKLGFSHLALGELREGRLVLQSLVRAYPKHEVAQLGVARLGELQRAEATGDVTVGSATTAPVVPERAVSPLTADAPRASGSPAPREGLRPARSGALHLRPRR